MRGTDPDQLTGGPIRVEHLVGPVSHLFLIGIVVVCNDVDRPALSRAFYGSRPCRRQQTRGDHGIARTSSPQQVVVVNHVDERLFGLCSKSAHLKGAVELCLDVGPLVAYLLGPVDVQDGADFLARTSEFAPYAVASRMRGVGSARR